MMAFGKEGRGDAGRFGLGRFLWLAVPLLAFGGSSSGCEILQGRACTSAGCYDQLTVELAGPLAPSFKLTVSAPGHEPQTLECSGEPGCRTTLLWNEATPEEVTVRYEAEGHVVERTVQPRYFRFRPNGRGCSPMCLQAQVIVDVGQPPAPISGGA